jgi:hypothetical protein
MRTSRTVVPMLTPPPLLGGSGAGGIVGCGEMVAFADAGTNAKVKADAISARARTRRDEVKKVFM